MSSVLISPSKKPRNISIADEGWREKISERHKKNIFNNIVIELKNQHRTHQGEQTHSDNAVSQLVYEQYASKIIREHWRKAESCKDFLCRVTLAIQQTVQKLVRNASTRDNRMRHLDGSHSESRHYHRCEASSVHQLSLLCQNLSRKLQEKEKTEQVLLDTVTLLKDRVAMLHHRLDTIEQVSILQINERKRKLCENDAPSHSAKKPKLDIIISSP
jgi:hypothetical protein